MDKSIYIGLKKDFGNYFSISRDQNVDWTFKFDPFFQNHHSVSLWLQDINGLEVIGSGKPFTSVTVRRGPLLEQEGEEKKHKEMKKENL